MALQTPTYPGINLMDNFGPALKGVGIAFTIISAATVILRFYSRITTHISIERDDWFILTAAVLCWAYNAVIMYEADHNYYGQHIGHSDPYHLEEYLKGLYSLAIVYPAALVFSKLSLLALYWRIFNNSGAKRPIQIVALLNIGWMIAAILVGILSCNPVRGFWDLSTPSTCIQEYDFFLTNECLTIALDIITLIIPLWSVAQLRASLSQRISVGITFGLGLGVTIISAIRLWQLVVAQERPGNDPTFNQTGAALWAMIEINVWIVVASIPALHPLVHDVYMKLSSSRQESLTLVPSKEQRTRRKGKTTQSTGHNSGRKLRSFWGRDERNGRGSREDFAQRGAAAGEGMERGYKVHVEGGGGAQVGSGWTPMGARRSNSALGTRGYEYRGERTRNLDVEMGTLPGIRVDREVYVGP